VWKNEKSNFAKMTLRALRHNLQKNAPNCLFDAPAV